MHAAVLAIALAAPAPDPSADLRLFDAACLDGEAKVSADAAKLMPLQLPSGTLDALRRAAEPDARNALLPRHTGEAPKLNSVYKVAARPETYLFLPDAAAPKNHRVARSCALLIKGAHYKDARNQLLGPQGAVLYSPPSLPAGAKSMEVPYFRKEMSGYRLTALQTDKWTVLSATPIGDKQ